MEVRQSHQKVSSRLLLALFFAPLSRLPSPLRLRIEIQREGEHP